jgi:hypothetical protein
MAYSTCEDCGTKLSGGICPNCSEELFIYTTQYEDLPETLSEEFTDKVKEQQEKENTRVTNKNER